MQALLAGQQRAPNDARMKRARDISVTVFASPEMIVILGIVAIYLCLGPALARLGSRIEAGPAATQWLALVPAVLLGVAAKDHSDILSPEGPHAAAYQRWPRYRMVKDRYFITLAYLLACTIVTVSLWALNVDFAEPAQLCLFFGSIAVSVTTFVLFFVAKITLRRLLATAD